MKRKEPPTGIEIALLVVAVGSIAASTITQAMSISQAASAADAKRSRLKEQRGLARADQIRKHRKLIGAQTVRFAKARVDLTGTVLDVRAEAEKALSDNLHRINSGFGARLDTVDAQENAAITSGVGNILATAGSAAMQGVSIAEQLATNTTPPPTPQTITT